MGNPYGQDCNFLKPAFSVFFNCTMFQGIICQQYDPSVNSL